MRYQRGVYTTFIILFIVFEVLFAMALLDTFGVVDHERMIGDTVEGIIAFGIVLTFLLGIILGIVLLTEADETTISKKTVKILMVLFYVISPFAMGLILLGVIFFGGIIGGVSQADMGILLGGLLGVLAVIAILITLFVMLKKHNSQWTRGQNIFFIIYNLVVSLASGVLIFLASMMSMHDGAIS